MTRVFGNEYVLIRVIHALVHQWFAMYIFRVLGRNRRNPILAFLAIARLAEVDWSATVVELFLFHCERSNFIFIAFTSGVTYKRADETEVAEGGYDEIHVVYREKFASRNVSRDFSDLSWQLILEMGADCTEYLMLEEPGPSEGLSE